MIAQDTHLVQLPTYCEDPYLDCGRLVSRVVTQPSGVDSWLFTCDWHCGNGPWVKTLAAWRREKGVQ